MKNTDDKKNIAVAGAGYWGKNLVRNFYELGVLRTICDSNQDRLLAFQEQYPGINSTLSYSHLLKDPGIRAVVIATPALYHYEMAKEALLAGKDVFVEKPMALEVKEGEELVRISKKEGRILLVGHILQYHPCVLKLKELINHGDLGKIQYIYSNRLNLGKIRTEENILWSFAPHDISVMLGLLGESPQTVTAHGGSFLQPSLVDVTMTTLSFPSGVKGHIFVSWLHPFKDQKLIVVGEKKMAVFDGIANQGTLTLYPHKVEWIDRIPVGKMAEGEEVTVETSEPLKEECRHFLECMDKRETPKSDGEEGLQVLKILHAFQESMDHQGQVISLSNAPLSNRSAVSGESPKVFIHSSAVIDDDCEIGEGTKIWNVTHIRSGSEIGKKCNIGQNVVVGPKAIIGNGVKIQNNVSVYERVTLEDDVFCGPSMVFTNVVNPRSHIVRKSEYKPTLVKKGATLGANCTILCGNVIGQYALVGAGAVVTRDVPDYAVVMGNPARFGGWICKCGIKLPGGLECGECGQGYVLNDENLVMKSG